VSRAAIGLGANVGDRAASLRAAIDRIAGLGSVVAVSSMFETAPWGITDQPAFLNAALVLDTELSPRALLDALLAIERDLGRDRAREVRWGPRRIDLDILLYDDRVEEGDPALPHPRLHERAFVLVPLAEIAPDLVHPRLGLPIGELARRVDASGVRRLGEVAPRGDQ
jgi:2-amino-4-hydroxy-6-hydroxymethyldihydropteridine diphosphokinase